MSRVTVDYDPSDDTVGVAFQVEQSHFGFMIPKVVGEELYRQLGASLAAKSQIVDAEEVTTVAITES